MAFLRVVFLSYIILWNIQIFSGNGITFENPLRFPFGGPFMGIFLALALPLDLKEVSVFFSYNIEANYVLPENQSQLTYPPIIGQRSLDRQTVYHILETKMKRAGFWGRECLLRIICEAAIHPFQHNGVLGDLVHLLLTPSMSINVGLEKAYENAELYGKRKKHCNKYTKKCSINLLDLFSKTQSIMDFYNKL